jgi:hypothetical protein
MNGRIKISKFLLAAITILLCLLSLSDVQAGDEDMNPTAYMQFDPVTGYMIPIENPPASQHAPATKTTTGPATPAEPATSMKNTQPVRDGRRPYPIWVPVLIGVIAIGMIAALIRKRKLNPESRMD